MRRTSSAGRPFPSTATTSASVGSTGSIARLCSLPPVRKRNLLPSAKAPNGRTNSNSNSSSSTVSTSP